MPKSKKGAVAKPVSDDAAKEVEQDTVEVNDAQEDAQNTAPKKTKAPNGKAAKKGGDDEEAGDGEGKKQRERFSGPAMRRLATSAGFGSVAKDVYPTLRHIATRTLEALAKAAWEVTQSAKRKTIGDEDVTEAAKTLGIGELSVFSGLPDDIVAALNEALPTAPVAKKKAEDGAEGDEDDAEEKKAPAKKPARGKAKKVEEDGKDKEGEGEAKEGEPTTKYAFAKGHVEDVVRSALKALESDDNKPRIGDGALNAFQETLETYLINLFTSAALVAWSRKASTLSQPVLAVALRIRGIF